MRRDGPEGPELPCERRQPEKEELVSLWPPGPGELALCILLFILFFALSWGGLVLWDEVFINTSDTAPETVYAVLTGAGRMAVSSAVLAVTALCIGKAIVIAAKFFARRRPRPLRQRSGSTGKLSTPWKSTWPAPAAGSNRLDDQLAEPGFSNIDDHGMGPPVPAGRGGGRGPEHPGGPVGC